MINLSDLEKIDFSGMYKIYDQWPEIAEKAFSENFESIKLTNIDHIIFAGMGGSGAIGDTFAVILSKTNIHVSVVKGYILPNTVNEKSLVITTSISGNTIETLSILKSAKEKKCNIIAIASGGKMEKYCKENDLNFRKISLLHSPRASFIGVLYSILKIIFPILPIKEEQVKESINELKKLREKILSKNLSNSNPALDLANWITKIPLIYFPWGLNAAAIRFKNSLQENSKLHSITEDIIEASHNGIVAWEKPSIVQPILLQGQEDYIKTKERWKIIKDYFEENKIEYKEIISINGGILTKIINLIYLLDYATIYNAVINQQDPTPVKSINFIKKRLE